VFTCDYTTLLDLKDGEALRTAILIL